MKHIIWKNTHEYSDKQVNEIVSWLIKNIYTGLPIGKKEIAKMEMYAKEKGLTYKQVVSVYHTCHIQNDIMASRNADKKMIQMRNNFDKMAKQLTPQNYKQKIKKFLIDCKLPVRAVVKVIPDHVDQKRFDKIYIDYFRKIYAKFVAIDKYLTIESRDYEIKLEDYLTSKKIPFKTEIDIKREKLYNITPDILLDEPIIIKLDNVEHQIHWMDAKNFFLINTPYFMKSLKSQSEKYNKAFGKGAFVFSGGIQSSIKIPDTILLDGVNL